ncbi:MAG TPA: ferritin-like domain-containing protein, partial [Polyangiaceae bacterium]
MARSASRAGAARVSIARTLRRALALHLPVRARSFAPALAPLLFSCGGATVTPGGSADASATDSSATHDAPASDSAFDSSSLTDTAAPCDDSADAGIPCTPVCIPPEFSPGEACSEATFGIYGSGASCGQTDAGALPMSFCLQTCPPFPTDAGTFSVYGCIIEGRNVTCEYGFCGTGRRPRGLRAGLARSSDGSVVGRWLARAAYLEAASVVAFDRLARELAAHGAPRSLQRAARRARGDEIRHARTVTRLAERSGAAVRRPRVAPPRKRSLEAVATENAVEGCVRETLGAALALAQARTAALPEVRRAMRSVARDEVRHA